MSAIEQAPGRSGGLLGRIFAIDLRALAAQRIALALILLYDLGSRCQWLRAHYSDEGILPRRALLERYDNHWFWSLHMLSGAWQVEALLFAIAGVCATAMLVGYRTRVATVLSWVLLASLHTRNPLVLQGGDVLLRCLMFWAMFLPMGARWSLDRSWGGADPSPRAITSIATAALLLQVCMVYWCTGILKENPIWTTDHTAIQYALSLGVFATPLGTWLLHAPPLVLQGFTTSCLMLERFGPCLVLIPLWSGSLRLAVVLLFMSFHLGLALTMRLGPFPYICIAAWLPFLPSWVFDSLGSRFSLGRGLALVLPTGPEDWTARLAVLRWLLVLPQAEIRPGHGAELTAAGGRTQGPALMVTDAGGTIHRDAAALHAALRSSPWAWSLATLLSRPGAWRLLSAGSSQLAVPVTYLERALRPPRQRAAGILHPLAAIACGSFLVLVALWNLRGVAPQAGRILLPNSWDPVVQMVRLDQRWGMFAPFPSRSDIWYSVPAKLRGGGQVDLLTGETLEEHPSSITQMPFYEDERWRKYLSNLRAKDNRTVRTYLAQYLYRTWNEQHARTPAQQVTRVDIRLWSRTTHLDHEDPFHAQQLWSYEPGRAAHKPAHPRPANNKKAAAPPALLAGRVAPSLAAPSSSAPAVVAVPAQRDCSHPLAAASVTLAPPAAVTPVSTPAAVAVAPVATAAVATAAAATMTTPPAAASAAAPVTTQPQSAPAAAPAPGAPAAAQPAAQIAPVGTHGRDGAPAVHAEAPHA